MYVWLSIYTHIYFEKRNNKIYLRVAYLYIYNTTQHTYIVCVTQQRHHTIVSTPKQNMYNILFEFLLSCCLCCDMYFPSLQQILCLFRFVACSEDVNVLELGMCCVFHHSSVRMTLHCDTTHNQMYMYQTTHRTLNVHISFFSKTQHKMNETKNSLKKGYI